MTFNRSRMFKTAHTLAKNCDQVRGIEYIKGDTYKECLSKALKVAYAMELILSEYPEKRGVGLKRQETFCDELFEVVEKVAEFYTISKYALDIDTRAFHRELFVRCFASDDFKKAKIFQDAIILLKLVLGANEHINEFNGVKYKDWRIFPVSICYCYDELWQNPR